MEFTQTTLGNEYRLVELEGMGRYYTYTAILVTAKEEIEAMSVVSMDWIRDYRNAAGDEMLIQLTVRWGQYLNRILPFKEALKLTLIRTPVDSTGALLADPILEQTFNAYLQAEAETDSIAHRPETADEESSDLVGLKTFSVQLQDPAFSLIRSEMVGGVFRDSRPFDILISLLNRSIQTMEMDQENAVLGINSIPPNNQTPRTTVILPHGIPLVSVAQKLQRQYGGIYTADIGCYLQKGYWHVWPLYNYKRFDTAEHTASFIIAPSNKMRGVERTYRVVDKHLTVVVTGGIQRVDPSETRLLNEGNATRFVNTENLIEGFFETGGNRAVAKRTNNANEYEAVSRQANPMSRVTDDMLHSNAFHEASKLVERNGAFFMMAWENSDPDLITPGLQCEVGFMVNDEPAFVNGVVVHAHGYSALAGTGLHQKVHQITTQVVVMVDRHAPAYQQYLAQ